MRRLPSFAFPAAGLLLALVLGSCDNPQDLVVPTVYLVAGRVADPTSSPFTPIPGARVWVETAPEVASTTTDMNGDFVLHGVPAGVQRLRAELAGHVPSISLGMQVDDNIDDVGLPLFTDAQIDSILNARGAPPWNRAKALFGMFAMRSNDVPLGSATISLSPNAPYAGGTLYQTGNGADPIVIDNPDPGNYSLTVVYPGFVWDGPYSARFLAGVVTFGIPRARPNMNGYVFADRSTGNAVEGAEVSVLAGPTGTQATTDFLGQFTLVGLTKGLYTVRAVTPGYLTSLSWPQDMQADTTLTFLITTPDSLAAWSAAAGGPALQPGMGHILVEARSESGGALILGAILGVNTMEGTAIPQSARWPALLLNVSPGIYGVAVSGGGIVGTPGTGNVRVRAGEVTTSRLDLPTTGSSP